MTTRRWRRRAWWRARVGGAVCWLCLWLIVVSAPVAPRPARADGGAPVVAYIVGGAADGAGMVVVDIARRRVVGTLHLGGDPHGLAFGTDSTRAVVAQAAGGHVAVIDVTRLRVVASLPVGPGPQALAADTTGATSDLFVANGGANTVTAIDLDRLRTLATIPVGLHPAGVAIAGPTSGIRNPDSPELYVANADDDTVTVVDVQTLRVVATIPVPGGPSSVVVPAFGGVAYVGTRAGTIVALDLARHQLMGTLLQLRGSAAGQMDYDGVTGEIYVPDATGQVVDVLRPASPGGDAATTALPAEPSGVLAFAGNPSAVAITSDGAYGFVTERATGQVVMFDVATHRTLATIAVGGGPRSVVTGPILPMAQPTPPGGAPPPPSVPGTESRSPAGVLAGALGVLLVGLAAYWVWRRRMRRKRP